MHFVLTFFIIVRFFEKMAIRRYKLIDMTFCVPVGEKIWNVESSKSYLKLCLTSHSTEKGVCEMQNSFIL